MPAEGYFVTFEGGDGAGKSTLIRALAEALRAGGVATTGTREPGAGKLGGAVRALLLDSDAITAETELFLFLADRANHCAEVIRPALARGELVLCDRFADSTLVYQGDARGLDAAFVRAANAVATRGLAPDRTYLLDLPPSVGLRRLGAKNRLDRQPIEFHEQVRAGFLALAEREPERVRVVDAARSPEAVLDEVASDLRARLAARAGAR